MKNVRTASPEELQGWFAGRLPDDWFSEAPSVSTDRDEVLVVGRLAEPTLPKDSAPDARTAALQGRIDGFREDTRGPRVRSKSSTSSIPFSAKSCHERPIQSSAASASSNACDRPSSFPDASR